MSNTPNNFQQGDIIYLNFNPQSGHEQMGRRPALVVSNGTFNSRSACALVCPITNTDRNYPLHVMLDDRTQTTGVVMADQVRSLDIMSRGAKYKEHVPDEITREVLDIISEILTPDESPESETVPSSTPCR